jgi:hypothetical protein
MPEKSGGPDGPRVKPRLRVKLAVVSASVLVGLLIFEVFLRAAGYTYPLFYVPDETRGWALKPGVEGWYRKEGASFVRVNSEGLRDREHAKQKPAGVLRIALLGDSYAEALQVEQERAFWSLAERRLRECPALRGREVEVINFGVSGYGTAQELFTLREKVWDYAPDVVLLAVTTNNDLIDNSRVLKGTDEIPYFVPRAGGLALDDSYRRNSSFRWRLSAPSRAGRWLRDNLRFVQAVHQAHGAIKTALAARRQRQAEARAEETKAPARAHNDASAAGQQAAPVAELGVANEIYREPSDAVWRDAWEVTEGLIATLHAEVEARGARFLAVTLSNPIQLHPEPAAREAFARRLGVSDLFYPERRFGALGAREGFTVLHLAPDMQRHADERRVFLHGFGRDLGNGHWNEAGHALAGELLARKLCEALAAPGFR